MTTASRQVSRGMDHCRIISFMLCLGLLGGCTTAPAPNDTHSRILNEMRLRPATPLPDLHNARIADWKEPLETGIKISLFDAWKSA